MISTWGFLIATLYKNLCFQSPHDNSNSESEGSKKSFSPVEKKKKSSSSLQKVHFFLHFPVCSFDRIMCKLFTLVNEV